MSTDVLFCSYPSRLKGPRASTRYHSLILFSLTNTLRHTRCSSWVSYSLIVAHTWMHWYASTCALLPWIHFFWSLELPFFSSRCFYLQTLIAPVRSPWSHLSKIVKKPLFISLLYPLRNSQRIFLFHHSIATLAPGAAATVFAVQDHAYGCVWGRCWPWRQPCSADHEDYWQGWKRLHRFHWICFIYTFFCTFTPANFEYPYPWCR